MTNPGKAEELLAQALRAQARNAPQVASSKPAVLENSSELAPDPGELPDFRAIDADVRDDNTPLVVPNPLAEKLGEIESPTDQLPPHYGLLSGTGASSLAREHAALGDPNVVARLAAKIEDPPAPARLALYWIFLLAALLGLAAGSVIGLLTLL